MDANPLTEDRDGKIDRLRRAIERAVQMHEAAAELDDPLIRQLAEAILVELGQQVSDATNQDQ